MNKQYGPLFFLCASSLLVFSCEKTKREEAQTPPQSKSVAGFVHQDAGIEYAQLLEKVKLSVPEKLEGYEASTLINSSKEASGNFKRESSLSVDLEKQSLTLSVIDPPKKDGARKKSGSLTTEVYLENGKAWIKQTFIDDPQGNWRTPVNVVGDTLVSPLSEFRYLDMSPAAVAAREGDLTYNLKARLSAADFDESPATNYEFVFGLDEANKGIFFDRRISNVSSGEKDTANGQDELKDIVIKIALSEKASETVQE